MSDPMGRWALEDEVKRLRSEIAAIKAKVREAMAEIGTSSLGHHKLREIVPDWASGGGDDTDA